MPSAASISITLAPVMLIHFQRSHGQQMQTFAVIYDDPSVEISARCRVRGAA
jgi:DNA gyrase inhibitor GyrI